MELINENDLQNVCGGIEISEKAAEVVAACVRACMAACVAIGTSGLVALLIYNGNKKNKAKKEENQHSYKIVKITKIVRHPARSIYCKEY